MVLTPVNRSVIAAVRRAESWPYHVFCLVGPRKSGLSTIARAWVIEREGYLLEPTLEGDLDYDLDQISGCDVAVDRADEVAKDETLLKLISAIDRQGGRLLLTARVAPSRWQSKSPDLISRLKAAPVAAIPAPDETLMRGRLQGACARTYLILPKPVEDYLVTRLGLNYVGIEDAIALLDSAAAERPLTVPLAKEVLAEHADLRAQLHGDIDQ